MKTKCIKPQKAGLLLSLIITLTLAACLPALAANDSDSIRALRQTSQAFASIAEKASPAVVGIEAKRSVEGSNMQYYMQSPFGDDFFERFFGSPRLRAPQRRQRTQTETVQGSGFIISSDGYILTNNHLVENAIDNTVTVSLNDDKTLKGKVVGTDPSSDVAVVKIDEDDLPTLALADSAKLKVGEWVVAIGNPFGLSHTVTAGIVSAKGRNDLDLENVDYQDFIQTDAAINPGNSGGPLLNLDAEVVGINSAILGVSGNVGIGFAIPINMAKSIADQLIKNGKVVRGFLGISMETNFNEDLANSLDLDTSRGALVKDVGEDTPAAKAGLKRYDVIIEVNGDAVKNASSLSSKISSYKPGTTVELTIIRNGHRKTVEVTLGERTQEALVKLSGGNEVLSRLGFTVANLTDEVIDQLGLDEDQRGVVIASVQDGSEAAEKGLQTGMVITEVNRQSVRNEKEFNDAVESAIKDGKQTLLLYVINGSRQDMVILRVPKE